MTPWSCPELPSLSTIRSFKLRSVTECQRSVAWNSRRHCEQQPRTAHTCTAVRDKIIMHARSCVTVSMEPRLMRNLAEHFSFAKKVTSQLKTPVLSPSPSPLSQAPAPRLRASVIPAFSNILFSSKTQPPQTHFQTLPILCPPPFHLPRPMIIP